MTDQPNSYAIKAEVRDCAVSHFEFDAQKTMYGGKNIVTGDHVFIFASENEGGCGLFCKGIVTRTENTPRTAAARQTPRVSVQIERCGTAMRPLGRNELRNYRTWSDDSPETELNFKLYRQATNKIVGLSNVASQFLNSFF